MSFVLLFVLNIVVWVVFYFVFKRNLRKSMGSQELLQEVREDVDQLVKELNLTSERNIGVLEERMAKLENLIRQADQRLNVWAKEEGKRAQTPTIYTRPKPSPVELPELPEPQPSRVAQTQQSLESPDRQRAVESAETMIGLSLREKVLAFRAQGLSPSEISQRAGATLAEVELILSLYPLRA